MQLSVQVYLTSIQIRGPCLYFSLMSVRIHSNTPFMCSLSSQSFCRKRFPTQSTWSPRCLLLLPQSQAWNLSSSFPVISSCLHHSQPAPHPIYSSPAPLFPAGHTQLSLVIQFLSLIGFEIRSHVFQAGLKLTK